jgi:hypothetical protein
MGEEIRQALIHLTEMHREFEKRKEAVYLLFPGTAISVKSTGLDEAISDLERQVPGFHIWFEERYQRYILIPKTDLELRS